VLSLILLHSCCDPLLTSVAAAAGQFLTKYCSTFMICSVSVSFSQLMSGKGLHLRRLLSYAALVGAPPYSHYWFLLLRCAHTFALIVGSYLGLDIATGAAQPLWGLLQSIVGA
jgi:hypothetical protein